METDKVWVNRNGQRHRTDGPAIDRTNGDKEWYINGKRHRTDGTAVEFADGTKHWYYHNIRLPFENYVVAAKWTDEQIVLWKLIHG